MNQYWGDIDIEQSMTTLRVIDIETSSFIPFLACH